MPRQGSFDLWLWAREENACGFERTGELNHLPETREENGEDYLCLFLPSHFHSNDEISRLIFARSLASPPLNFETRYTCSELMLSERHFVSSEFMTWSSFPILSYGFFPKQISSLVFNFLLRVPPPGAITLGENEPSFEFESRQSFFRFPKLFCFSMS